MKLAYNRVSVVLINVYDSLYEHTALAYDVENQGFVVLLVDKVAWLEGLGGHEAVQHLEFDQGKAFKHIDGF